MKHQKSQHSSSKQSPESNLKSPARKTISTSGSNDIKCGRVSKTSDVSSPSSRRKLLSPCERFIEEKKQEFKSKREKANAKRKEPE